MELETVRNFAGDDQVLSDVETVSFHDVWHC